jgi:hypothetical protein
MGVNNAQVSTGRESKRLAGAAGELVYDHGSSLELRPNFIHRGRSERISDIHDCEMTEQAKPQV